MDPVHQGSTKTILASRQHSCGVMPKYLYPQDPWCASIIPFYHMVLDGVIDGVGWCLMTHKYRGSIVVLSINKSVEPNEE